MVTMGTVLKSADSNDLGTRIISFVALALVACRPLEATTQTGHEPNDPAPAFVGTALPALLWDTRERAADFDSGPIGLRLEVGPLDPYTPVEMTRTGATAGEEVVFHIGDLGTLEVERGQGPRPRR
jgi:hypothetical protein